MTEFDRNLVSFCLMAVVALTGGLALAFYLLLRRKKARAENRRPWLSLGVAGTVAILIIALVIFIIVPIVLPMVPIVLFASLEWEELTLIFFAFLFVFSGLCCILLAVWAPFERADDSDPSPFGEGFINLLKRIGAVVLGLALFLPASESLRDFMQPRLFVEGRVDRTWTEMKKYREHAYIQIDGKQHRRRGRLTRWPLRAAACVRTLERVRIGFIACNISRPHLRHGSNRHC